MPRKKEEKNIMKAKGDNMREENKDTMKEAT